MKQEFVKDWMTQEVIRVQPDTLLAEVEQLMVNKHIRHLPVVEHDRLVGMVSWGDVRNAEPSPAEPLRQWELDYLVAKIKTRQIMTRHPLTIGKEATIGEAAGLMQTRKIGGLPVVDEAGKVVGIITETDILRTVVHTWGNVE
jgi:CBS domain-containing protein